MLTSLAWLNKHLSPPTLSAEEAEHVLTHVGFPIESVEPLPSGDVRLEVELTSNRGDCLCHVGLAREVAAATGRTLVSPDHALPPQTAELASAAATIENRLAPTGCPRFTARVIRGVKVGPSPKWLVDALESVGQRSINNVVDVTNFVLLEMGHPSHVFDLAKLEGRRLIIRPAHRGEKFKALDGRDHTLTPDEMVVADAQRAVSLAGVIGGLETGVTGSTTDVLLEMATWDPVAVRRASRRLDIRTEAGRRFERVVDARDLSAASERAAKLIVELAGGKLLAGLLDEGAPAKPRTTIFLRSARCHRLLGIEVATPDMIRLLRSMGIEVSVERHVDEERLKCLIPPHRHDLTREVDLIEEVARLNGLDKVKVAGSLKVNLSENHPPEWAQNEKAAALALRVVTGCGFFETVTFSFITKAEAELFLPPGLRALKVDEERRKGAPYLRPSIIPSLMTCRRANQDAQVKPPSGPGASGLKLFEVASVFAEVDDGPAFARATRQQRHLALIADAGTDHDSRQQALRRLRGVIEHVAHTLAGRKAQLSFEPSTPPFAALDPDASAGIRLNGAPLGYLGMASKAALRHWGLEVPVAMAEVNMGALVALYPPASNAAPLPEFPAIERDLSLVVDEQTEWARCQEVIRAAAPADLLESMDFVGAYRGKPLETGKKSLTLRLTFRDPGRTLRNEELDQPMSRVLDAARTALSAQIRGIDIP